MPLDPETAALLERQKHVPPRSSLDVAATREMMRRSAALAGEPPPLSKIEDVILPGEIRARQYWPAMDERLPIVYFHGGRFLSGDLESHDMVCRVLAITAACRVFAVDYRWRPNIDSPPQSMTLPRRRMGLRARRAGGSRRRQRGGQPRRSRRSGVSALGVTLPGVDLPDDRRGVQVGFVLRIFRGLRAGRGRHAARLGAKTRSTLVAAYAAALTKRAPSSRKRKAS